jgi:hypothetical protein
MISNPKYFIGIILFLFCSCQQSKQSNKNGEIANLSDTSRISDNNSGEKRDSIFKELQVSFLKVYNEPDLKNEENETYRFIWIASLEKKGIRSAVFRIQEINDKYLLTVKYAQSEKITEINKDLTSEQWLEFMGSINAAYFWSMETSDNESMGTLPANWYIEGKHNPKYYPENIELYHIVLREEAYSGCFRNIGELLASFSGSPELVKAIAK